MPRPAANKKAATIFTADIHLRDDTPVCRTDNFAAARARKVAWLRDLQADNGGCPIIDGGDLFDQWHVSSALEGWVLLNLPDNMVTVPGQHDLPQHSLKLFDRSSLHVLEAAGKVRVLKTDSGNRMHSPDLFKFSIGNQAVVEVFGFPYGQEFAGISSDSRRKIAIVHAYVGETVPPFIADGWTPAQLLAALPGYDVIVAGDHHVPLVYEHRGRLVVVPGSMMRADADQQDFRPRAYLWYADTNTVEAAYYPIEAGVVSREHLEKKEERDARLDAFVARLDEGGVGGLSFEANLENYMGKNKVDKAVSEIVWEAVDGKHSGKN